MRWYPVPNYTFRETNQLPPEKRPAQVVDAYGQMIAECGSLEEAEHIAWLHNQWLKPRKLERVS